MNHPSATSWEGRVGPLVARLTDASLPTSDRAALRRLHPLQPVPLVFYRFAIRTLPDDWDADPENEKNWMTLVGGISLMAPLAHNPERTLGRALASTNYAEIRVERLLSSYGDTQRTLLLRAVRFLDAKSTSFNWADAARLLFTRDPDRRASVRRKIAQDYYSRQVEQTKG